MSEQLQHVEAKRKPGRPRKNPILTKESDPSYILNPRTNNWVMKNGVVGQKLAKQTTRKALDRHMTTSTINSMISNRNLLKSGLSDEELREILVKLVDVKLSNKEVPLMIAASNPAAGPRSVSKFIPMLKAAKDAKIAKAKAKAKAKAAKPKRPRGRPRKHRFVIRSPPPMPDTTDAETGYDDTAYEDQSSSDSDSDSDSD